jgi:4a-hydroxytetrahydrobiopterin dehydratase
MQDKRMETQNCLINKTCSPCQGGIPPLTRQEVDRLLHELNGDWSINDKCHLYKEYKFNDFKDPMAFANNIADIAEHEGHHPDLKIAWGLCVVEIWTHKINGLTESDFILAAKIEAAYA